MLDKKNGYVRKQLVLFSYSGTGLRHYGGLKAGVRKYYKHGTSASEKRIAELTAAFLRQELLCSETESGVGVINNITGILILAAAEAARTQYKRSLRR